MLIMNELIINDKISILKQLNKEANLYEFTSKMQPEEIKKFEEKYNIILPLEYKYFLLNIASGILYKSDSIWNVISEVPFWDYYTEENNYNPSIEFPLTTRIYDSNPENNNDYDANRYPYETKYCRFEFEEFTNGILPILDIGCGSYYFIVVNGEEYGNIWCDNYMSNSEIYPEFSEEKQLTRLNFEQWLDIQLDRAINTLKYRLKIVDE